MEKDLPPIRPPKVPQTPDNLISDLERATTERTVLTILYEAQRREAEENQQIEHFSGEERPQDKT